eukprot:6115060-Alexandrium_andersonii.AAC.1
MPTRELPVGAWEACPAIPGECHRRAPERQGAEGGQPDAGIGQKLHGSLRRNERGLGDPQRWRGHPAWTL